MITFLFWNTNSKPLGDAIAAIAKAESVDILMLCECAIETRDLLTALNRETTEFHYTPGQNRRICMFTRFPGRYLAPSYESDRLSIRRLTLPAVDELLLVVAHFPSKLFWSDESQMLECANLGNKLLDSHDT